MSKIHRFYFPCRVIAGEQFEISDPEITRQIRNVLHLERGEQIIFTDGEGREVRAEINGFRKLNVVCTVLEIRDAEKEESAKLWLFASVLKRENFELVAQKATEIGVARIIPVLTNRTVKQGLNFPRLKKIVREAGEQSGRVFFPEVSEIVSLTNAIQEAKKCSTVFFCDASGKDSIASIKIKKGDAALFVGPEGGWKEEEVDIARENGFSIVHLGHLTLRAETAAIAASYAVLLRLSHGS